jgi:glycosyltransferase involved in cell wall biosynthesis
MKILLLTQYFPPEVGAPQNRLFELAIRLQKKGAQVDVLTAMPNYPAMEIHPEFKGKIYLKEEMQGLKVFRSWIFVSKKKSIPFRLLNYFSFVFSSLFFGLFIKGKYDFLMVESPPLFLGITARLLAMQKRAKMIFNVSDLWPESAEKLGLVTNKRFLHWATILEEYLYRKSALITGQTQGIVRNIKTRFPQKEVYWLKNGVDMNFFDAAALKNSQWRQENGYQADQQLFLYAGILGHAQKLETILEAAALLKEYSHIRFIMMGSGPEKDFLLSEKERLQLNNVDFIGVQPKSKMPEIVAAMNATVIPLRKLDLFLGAIPSKIFENLSMKKPIILGVDGEARELFIEDGKAGVFFEPENAQALADAVVKVASQPDLQRELGENGFRYVAENFERDKLASDFYEFLNKHNC